MCIRDSSGAQWLGPDPRANVALYRPRSYTRVLGAGSAPRSPSCSRPRCARASTSGAPTRTPGAAPMA
eukprot:10103464-Alexandrium_andersonii.AAC.1